MSEPAFNEYQGLFVIGLVIGACFGWVIGSLIATHEVHHQAIEHHAAHYAITNQPDGKTEFQWNQ